MKHSKLLFLTILFVIISIYLIGSITRSISNIHDNKETLIRNSNGNYWEPTGENIQTAIDDAESTGGGTVWLPAGTLVPSSTIYLKDNVRLVGKGMGITTIKAESNYGGTMIRSSSSARQLNVTVSDLTIDGNYVMGNPLYLHSVSGFIIERVHARRSLSNGFGVFGNCERGFMSDCMASELQGYSYEGFAINSAWDSTFSNLIATDIAYMGMDFHTLHNCALNNLIVKDSGMGIKFFGDPGEKGGNNVVTNVVIQSISYSGDGFGLWIKREYNSSFTNINVEAEVGIVLDGSNDINLNNFNIQADGTQSALHISNWLHDCERINIANGIVKHVGSGRTFYAKGIKDATFSNVQFVESPNYNVFSDANNVLISECSFDGGNERGLIVKNSDEFIISGSNFKDNNGAGIYILGTEGLCTNFVISDNIITYNNEGIRVDAFAHDNYIITNNILTDNTGQGVRDQGTGSNKFIGDNLL
ncbi:right-handed parallel beta-helix repeat-containing protein [archaeon]|nr:right-handed parallel beta-helix repeat-containing protein [archaeon]